jgi:hypothetical protein
MVTPVLGRHGYSAIKDRIVEGAGSDLLLRCGFTSGTLAALPPTAFYGVRVRAWIKARLPSEPSEIIGGRRFDLGDRTSESSHRVVQVETWVPKWSQVEREPFNWFLWATAECISDVANDPSTLWLQQDRHTATRYVHLG